MKIVGMDGYPIQLSRSGRISTIQWNLTPAGLHVSRRSGWTLITVLTPVRQSTDADCRLSDRCLADSLRTVGASRAMTHA